MKSIALLLIILFSVCQLRAQQNAAFYDGKIMKYTKMKKTGAGLTITGGVLVVAGAVLLSTATYTNQPNGYGGTNRVTSDPKGVIGGVCLIASLPLLGVGVPYWIIGSSNVRKYTLFREHIGLNLKVGPHQTGLAMRYRF